MKQLLVGLLALGSFAMFADVSVEGNLNFNRGDIVKISKTESKLGLLEIAGYNNKENTKPENRNSAYIYKEAASDIGYTLGEIQQIILEYKDNKKVKINILVINEREVRITIKDNN